MTRVSDVVVEVRSSAEASLVPKGYITKLPMSSSVKQHLRFLAQKWNLRQDTVLLGHPSPYRRHLAFSFAEACDIEVEYVKLSRDTTESDLKQRRELVKSSNGDTNVIFHDQAPVRAAINGRLLVLDGLEQVERNVLPTLNNLLENREMQLDDGRFLGSPDLPVHPDFKVVALSLQVPPYSGNTVDPPLRSRFQSRYVDDVSTDELIEMFSGEGVEERHLIKMMSLHETLRNIKKEAVSEGVSLSTIAPTLSISQMRYCFGFDKGGSRVEGVAPTTTESVANRALRCIPSLNIMRSAINARFRDTMAAAYDNLFVDVSLGEEGAASTASLSQDLTWSQHMTLVNLIEDHNLEQHPCLLGHKGSGKSVIARAFARETGLSPVTFNLYSDLTSRDLLQRRVTDSEGNTTWSDSPLVLAARTGQLAILDGIDRIDYSALVALQRLLQEGEMTLPSGEFFSAHPHFRCLALGLTPSDARLDDTRQRYGTSAMGFTYHTLPELTVQDMAAVLSRSDSAYSSSPLHRVAKELEMVGTDVPELMLNLRHLLRLQCLGYGLSSSSSVSGLYRAVEDTLLVRFLPETTRAVFDEAMTNAGVTVSSDHSSSGGSSECMLAVEDSGEGMVSIGDVIAKKRLPSEPSRVPSPLFYDNLAQLATLRNLLHSYSSGVKAMLLVGNQGVGKNKLVDRLLHLLSAEREYMQLHRDSTVQSLTLVPTLEDGAIVYKDSVVVQAAKNGRVLVVDEADKAPLEVVCILKALAEDEELVLNDGRKLISREKYGSDELREQDQGQVSFIHPDFRLVVLANRPGMPFLGNNFYRECGDVFDSYIIDNLPLESELSLLQSYGKDVDPQILRHLAHAFADLRALYDKGDLSYPFSAREAVSVVKHIQEYPTDGVTTAVENILGFEGLSPPIRELIAKVFQANDIPVSLVAGVDVGQREVRLVTPLPLADAQEVVVQPLVEGSSTVHLSVACAPLSVSEWQSSQLSESALEMQSSRLRSFSEEYASFWLGREEEKHNTLRRVAGAVSEAGNLHVLTTYPLELHSYLHIDNKAPPSPSAGGGGSAKYIRHELLSADMGWRLGHVTPVVSKYNEGVVVVLPELSMLLKIPTQYGDGIKAAASMVTLPDLKAFLDEPGAEQSGGGGSTSFSWMSMRAAGSASGGAKTGGDDGVLRVATLANDGTPVLALWRRGSDKFALVNASAGQLAYVSVEVGAGIGGSVRIESLVSGRGADDGAAPEMLMRTVDGRVLRAELPTLLEGSLSVRGQELAPTEGDKEAEVASELFLRKLAEGGGNITTTATRQGTVIPPSADTHAAISLPGIWRIWRRGSGRDTHAHVLHTAGPSAQAAATTVAVTERRAHDPTYESDGEAPAHTSSSRTELEVCTIGDDEGQDGKSAVLRSIPLAAREGGSGGGPKKKTKEDLAGHSVAALATVQGPRLLTAVVQSNGYVRLFEAEPNSLQESLSTWESMTGEESDEGESGGANGWGISRVSGPGAGNEAAAAKGQADAQAGAGLREKDGWSIPKTGLDKPKHGKEDEKNEAHVGGNTWAGGTGGSDTAGLGGRGGPYRLDKGHRVHQVSDAAKEAVSEESRARAAAAAKEGLETRLAEISLGKGTFDVYLQYRERVQREIGQLKGIMEELNRRAKERKWLFRQGSGELDDNRLVDGLTGEKLVWKKRGNPSSQSAVSSASSGTPPHVKRLHFVVDVSGSMYRFNGQDRRLERLLEAMLLVLESIPTSTESQGASTIEYQISGHSGDAPDISFLDFEDQKPTNEAERYRVLEKMVAHSQFCLSGDHTCAALDMAVKEGALHTSESNETFVFLISDANFERYGITPKTIAGIMDRESQVNAHLILLASFGSEAQEIKEKLGDRVSICMSTNELPKVFEKLLSSSMAKSL